MRLWVAASPTAPRNDGCKGDASRPVIASVSEASQKAPHATLGCRVACGSSQ